MDDKFLQIAKKAATEAGEIVAGFFGKLGDAKFKDGDSSNLLTKADLASEKLIKNLIKKNFPDHNIIAEEAGKTNQKSEYTWVIDPLDGTTSFSSKMPHFGIAIGLLKNNKPVLGVINWVLTRELYWAEAGKGAYLNGKKIKGRKNNKLEEAVIGFEVGTRKYRDQKFKQYVEPLFFKVRYPYFIGSSAVSFVLLAKGSLDAVIEEAWPWDFVAGVVIVREAGGKVTDFAGNEPDWTKERLSVIASNGLIHDQILKELK